MCCDERRVLERLAHGALARLHAGQDGIDSLQRRARKVPQRTLRRYAAARSHRPRGGDGAAVNALRFPHGGAGPHYGPISATIRNRGHWGTVLKRMMKCGHPQCACHRDPAQRHGPYFEWTYKVNGKTVNVKLSPQAAPLYLAATKQNRKLKVALARMERLSRTALARLAQQAENTD